MGVYHGVVRQGGEEEVLAYDGEVEERVLANGEGAKRRC